MASFQPYPLCAHMTVAENDVFYFEITKVKRTEGLNSLHQGDQVRLLPQPEAVHLFDPAAGLRLADV